MIECRKEELASKGFTLIPGLIEGVLHSDDVYACYSQNGGKLFLTLKNYGGSYFPHRARDVNGDEYGEDTLLRSSRFGLSDLEEVEDLIKFLEKGNGN